MLVTWLSSKNPDKVYIVRNADNYNDYDVCIGKDACEDVIACMFEENVRAVVVESL